MRIAVLADIHGNLPALLAVLAELYGDPVDAIVVAGDAVGGPLVAETLTTLEARPEPVYWIAGNSEREAFVVHSGGEATDDEPGRAAAWSARALDDGLHHATLAAAPIARVLDDPSRAARLGAGGRQAMIERWNEASFSRIWKSLTQQT